MVASFEAMRGCPVNTEVSVLAYGIREACAASSLGRTRLYALIAEGKLEARSCGGRTLIPAESLRSFLATLPPAAIRQKNAQQAA
jgi:excisionase family DNA binding protein